MTSSFRIVWENGELRRAPIVSQERNTDAAKPSNPSTMFLRNALRLNLNQATGGAASLLNEPARDSDEALVLRAKDGDFSAYERLFDRHRDMVYRFVYQMAPRRDDAEDIVQEVFVRAYQNLHRYRDEAKFTTWLLRIATNLGTDKARMSNRRQALEQQEAAGSLTWMTVGTNFDDPVERMDRDQRSMILRKALAALPDHHRTVVIMRDIEEMEYADIAEVLKTSVGGAKLRVLRGRRALRDRLLPLMQEAAH